MARGERGAAAGLSRRTFVFGVAALAFYPRRSASRDVYTVTDAGDDERDGQLRAGVEQRATDIRFAIEEPIRLRGDLVLDYPGLRITNAGAPVCPEIDGRIVTRSSRIQLRGLAIHRTGQSYTGREDCLAVHGGSDRVRIVECSFMGATDENVDVNETGLGGGRPARIELVRCVLARPVGGLGFNPYNMLVSQSVESIWIFGCLFSNGRYRNPVTGADFTSLAHNLVYSVYGMPAVNFEGSKRTSKQRANLVANHFISPPGVKTRSGIWIRKYEPIQVEAFLRDNLNYDGRSDPFVRDATSSEFLTEVNRPLGRIAPRGQRLYRAGRTRSYVLGKAGPGGRGGGPKHPLVQEVKLRVAAGTEPEDFL